MSRPRNERWTGKSSEAAWRPEVTMLSDDGWQLFIEVWRRSRKYLFADCRDVRQKDGQQSRSKWHLEDVTIGNGKEAFRSLGNIMEHTGERREFTYTD